jgi:hypothetical protein
LRRPVQYVIEPGGAYFLEKNSGLNYGLVTGESLAEAAF